MGLGIVGWVVMQDWEMGKQGMWGWEMGLNSAWDEWEQVQD